MLLYLSYLANQENNCCCWLYAPAIAQCFSSLKKDFDTQVQYFKDVLKSKNHSIETINKWFLSGILPNSNIINDMGLTRIGYLNNYVIQDLINGTIRIDNNGTLSSTSTQVSGTQIIYDNVDLTATYWKLYDLLKMEGPFVLQYPSLGSGNIHQSAITGIIFGKESVKDKFDDVFLIMPHTQALCLTVLPVLEILVIAQKKRIKVELFRVPNRFGKPLRPDMGTVYSSSGVTKFGKESIVLST